MPGTHSFLERIDLTRRFDESLRPFLDEHGIKSYPFGSPIILKGAPAIQTKLKKLIAKKYPAALMLKYSPDFIVHKLAAPESILLVDTKASVTPVFKDAQIELIRQNAGLDKLDRHDIGVIEREAWDVYTTNYPTSAMAVCFATPYHPRLLLMEWCSKILPMYRLASETNLQSGGSGTPHVNIHLGMMRTLEEFLADELDIKVNANAYAALLDVVRAWPLIKPTTFKISWAEFLEVGEALKRSCPWLTLNVPKSIKRKNIFDELGL